MVPAGTRDGAKSRLWLLLLLRQNPPLTEHRFVEVGELRERWEQVGKVVFSEQSEEKLKPSVLVLLVLPLQAGSLFQGVGEKQTKSFKFLSYTDNCFP